MGRFTPPNDGFSRWAWRGKLLGPVSFEGEEKERKGREKKGRERKGKKKGEGKKKRGEEKLSDF